MRFSFFFHDPSTSEIYTLSLHDALPIWFRDLEGRRTARASGDDATPRRTSQRESVRFSWRSEEHTSELQSPMYLVCRLLLEKKKKINYSNMIKQLSLKPTEISSRQP